MQLYSHFEKNGYRFEAYIPANDEDIDAFEIRVLVGDEIQKTLYLRLTYLPVFGVDVDDVRQIEAFADAMMKTLPEAPGYAAAASSALDTIEAEFGGTLARARLAQTPPRSGPAPGNSSGPEVPSSTRSPTCSVAAGKRRTDGCG